MLEEQKHILADRLQKERYRQAEQHYLTSPAEHTEPNPTYQSDTDQQYNGSDKCSIDEGEANNSLTGLDADYQRNARAERYQQRKRMTRISRQMNPIPLLFLYHRKRRRKIQIQKSKIDSM